MIPTTECWYAGTRSAERNYVNRANVSATSLYVVMEIEEEPSLAMLRQCKKMFYKEEGYSRMTSTCGAQM